jgi:hypothetical protein
MREKRQWKPTSILLDDATKTMLDQRDPVPRSEEGVPFAARPQGNRSLIIRETVRRYDEICRKEMPALDADEKKLVREAGREGPTAPDATSFGILLDSVRRQGPAGEQLMMRILALSTAQQFAVLDDVERYWAGKRRDEITRAGAHAGGRSGASSTRKKRRS